MQYKINEKKCIKTKMQCTVYSDAINVMTQYMAQMKNTKKKYNTLYMQIQYMYCIFCSVVITHWKSLPIESDQPVHVEGSTTYCQLSEELELV